MNKKLIVMSILLLVGIFTLAGCKKTGTEKVSEENVTGGIVDVDIKDEEFTVDVGNGTMQVGADVSLPDNWADDIHVTEGNIISASDTEMSNGITIESDKSIAEVKKEYDEKLVEDGWKVTMSMGLESSAIIAAEKDIRNVTLNITTKDEKTIVMVIVNSTE